jgi:hypothetical protein
MKLLSTSDDDPMRGYASLLVLDKLINSYPAFYVAQFHTIYAVIRAAIAEKPLLVQGVGYVVSASFAQVDPKAFTDLVADEIFAITPNLLLEFPYEVAAALCLFCRMIPGFIRTKLPEMKQFVADLLCEPDPALDLLTELLKSFGGEVLPLDFLNAVMEAPMTQSYVNFIIALASVDNGLGSEGAAVLCNRLKRQLAGPHAVLALHLLANLPAHAIIDAESLVGAITRLSSASQLATRVAVPNAACNVAEKSSTIRSEDILVGMLQRAIYDNSPKVRESILRVLRDSKNLISGQSQFLPFLQLFVNDDTLSVRRLSYQILAKLAEINPICVSSITRRSLLNAFFIVRHVMSIRQRSRIACALPELIRASAMTIKAYSGTFIAIADLSRNNSPNLSYKEHS